MGSFHATPAGQALIDKQPAVQQRMMKVMMKPMAEIGPRMQQMTQAPASAAPVAPAK